MGLEFLKSCLSVFESLSKGNVEDEHRVEVYLNEVSTYSEVAGLQIILLLLGHVEHLDFLTVLMFDRHDFIIGLKQFTCY